MRKKMMKFRIARILVGINLPPVIGSILFYAWLFSVNSHNFSSSWLKNIEAFFELVGFAYIVIGLYAAVSTLLIEFIIFRFIKDKRLWLFSGMILGGLSGALFQDLAFTLLGVLVGATTIAILIQLRSHEYKNA